MKALLRFIFSRIYRVQVHGLDQIRQEQGPVIVVANHTSFIDAALLYTFLPMDFLFAINTHIANHWYVRFLQRFIKLFPMDPTNPLSMRALIRKVQEGQNVVIFPEGRITVTGSLMKIYQGPGLVALKTQAKVLPVCIHGAQYTPFSRLKGRVRVRWFPEIRLMIQPAQQIHVPDNLWGRARRDKAGKVLSDIMTDMVMQSSNYRTTLFDRLLDARKIHGGKHLIAEDMERHPIDYNTMLTKALVLGKVITQHTKREERVGILLPGALSCLVSFWALHAYGRVPAMLNYTAGAKGMISACETATIKTVVTAKRFIKKAGLEDEAHALSKHTNLIFLEDLVRDIPLWIKLRSWVITRFDWGLKPRHRRRGVSPDSPAVVLFTSGSEGTAKGVVLSHSNILANIQQMAARIDFSAQDIALNPLPLFHSYGLTVGALLPVLSGIKTFLYPSPLHYKVIPEIAYDIGATLMFGTNTFLAGYAKHAHPYDFYSVRYVFAGAEKLKDEVRQIWERGYGVRIFEGYGATETSPVLSNNSPMDNKIGSVGRLLPMVEYALLEVPGLKNGKRLLVKGPNIMLGYLLHDNPGKLIPPVTEIGKGWYDTGDIVDVDEGGFITIRGRAKRFAKVAGEMVSLTAVEALASKTWPDAQSAAVAIPDPRKGEQIVLMTTQAEADRNDLLKTAQAEGASELMVPRKIMQVVAVPVLGSGKTDYVTATALVGDTA